MSDALLCIAILMVTCSIVLAFTQVKVHLYDVMDQQMELIQQSRYEYFASIEGCEVTYEKPVEEDEDEGEEFFEE